MLVFFPHGFNNDYKKHKYCFISHSKNSKGRRNKVANNFGCIYVHKRTMKSKANSEPQLHFGTFNGRPWFQTIINFISSNKNKIKSV